MKLITSIPRNLCCGCGACYSVCPVGAIEMKEDNEGFLYPFINSNCIKCKKCMKVCQSNNSYMPLRPIKAWAVQAIDDKIREKSSSGGIFPLFAMNMMSKGGHVCGAAFKPDYLGVHHIFDDIDKTCGSKYIQSAIENSYVIAKKILDRGELLLFSGVPCQISGLKHFLEKDYDNLFCVQVICHGVPSEKVWRKYIAYESNDNMLSCVNFRDKRNGWNNYGVCLHFGKKEKYSGLKQNPYMLFFLRNYSLRPSCYECLAKNNCSHADVTIGDFWGIEQVVSNWADNKGASLVACHTLKGVYLMNAITPYIKKTIVNFDEAISKNTAYSTSVAKPQLRERFFMDVQTASFKQLKRKYGKYKKKSIKQFISKNWILKIARRVCERYSS